MPFEPRLESALGSPEPLAALRDLVRSLQEQGRDEGAITQFFEEARGQLRLEGRERDEDLVLEVMDFVVGWCSPHMSLQPGAAPAPAKFHSNG